MVKSLNILGVPVHPLALSEAKDKILTYVQDKEKPCTVFSINPEIIMAANEDKVLEETLKTGTINLADGVGVLWAGKILGYQLPSRIGGIDLVEEILADGKELKIYLLGGKEGVAQRAAEKIQASYPHINVVGTHHGYYSTYDLGNVRQEIIEAQADILFVGLGCPRQEKFIQQEAPILGIAVCMAVGGSFDVLSGETRRAPLFLRKIGLEWLFRGFCQPSRLPRIMKLPQFVYKVWREKLNQAEPGKIDNT